MRVIRLLVAASFVLVAASPAFAQKADPKAKVKVYDLNGRTVLAAYDWALKSSHAFNMLDARGAISVSQRAGMILNIRKLACAIAAAYVAPPEAAAAPAKVDEVARG